ncbi:MAG: YibE/F family protein [Jiangellaceae bacterium]
MSGQGVLDVVTSELVAQEVVRALVGGLGIVAAVPVTTAAAALAVRERPHRSRGRRARAAVGISN